MKTPPHKQGSALILALWVIILLSLLISSFAFDMHIEAGIASYYRKRLKAEYLARAGIEEAIMLLSTYKETDQNSEGDSFGEEEGKYGPVKERIENGGLVEWGDELRTGSYKFTIYPAESRRNVNKLDREKWEDVLESSGITDVDLMDELIDCFFDWTDKNEDHRLNGAESDDSFYDDRGYEVKNAPLDTVDELTLIKGFSKAIVYGGFIDEDQTEYVEGVAGVLTAWGDGRINPNAADSRTLASVGLSEDEIDAILSYRQEEDEEGQLQYFENVEEVVDLAGVSDEFREFFVIKEAQYFQVQSIGISGEPRPIERVTTCILKVTKDEVTPVYWLEEQLP